MNARDLGFLPAWQMASAVKNKKLSPVEIVDALLTRIEKINPRVNAYCTIAADMARKAARKAEAAVMGRGKVGPLTASPWL